MNVAMCDISGGNAQDFNKGLISYLNNNLNIWTLHAYKEDNLKGKVTLSKKGLEISSTKQRLQGRVYALTTQNAKSNVLVECTILCFSTWAHVLFDLGLTHSFISTSFASLLNLKFVLLHWSLCVKTLMGSKVETKWVCCACVLYIEGHEVTMNLVLLYISIFDVIVRMNWLTQHHIVLLFEESNISNLL